MRIESDGAELLGRELAERGCEALLIVSSSSRDPDLAPFVGPVHLGRAFLIVPRPDLGGGAATLGFLTPMERGEAARTGLGLLPPGDLDVERLVEERPEPSRFWGELLRRALGAAGIPPGRLAFAGHLGAGLAISFSRDLAEAGYHATDGHELVRLLRKTKGAEDVEAIREAARGTVAAFRRVADLLARADRSTDGALRRDGEPVTVGRLRREVFRVLADYGLEQPEGNIVAPAEEGAVPHSIGTDGRVLRSGESLVVDLFPRGRLFADCTRTFCVGKPPEMLRRAHGSVLEALQRAREGARPGVRGWTLQEEACRVLGNAGFPTPISDPGTEIGYVHNLGHGVGYELHEYPSFKKDSGAEGLLGAGDVVTIEPGLYDPEAGWGVRLEDLLVLGEGGIEEDLTPLPYDLDPEAW